ncbi:MAG: threonylcarbamoyl-AMP synthase [Nitrospinae bacterium]|nr:threonylcarbamoyl-AMP synthase [Nitrospinota bacterium]
MSRILPVNPGSPEEEAIRQAGEELNSGNIVALPTDTIYGLCTNALDKEAVEKLYETKGREDEKGAPVLIGCRSQLKGLAGDISPLAFSLMDSLWPSGLTLILPASPNLSPLLAEGGSSIAVRMPAQALCRVLAIRVGPFVATSANASGEPPLQSAQAIFSRFQNKVGLVLDGGTTENTMPSTVVDVRGEKPQLLREGMVDFDSVVQAWNNP